MSQRANPVKVGAFVVAGLALAIMAVLVVGSGQLFSRRIPILLFFPDSVNGLTVGSPVKFKGVPVGIVKRIQLAFDSNTGISQYIPVLIELDENLIVSASGQPVDLHDRSRLRAQVDRGLRASLDLESFITGRLFVQLDYRENAPPPVFHQKVSDRMEIPTVSTGLAEFFKSLERADIPGVLSQVRSLIESLERIAGEMQMKQLNERTLKALEAAEKLLNSPEIKGTFASITETSDAARQLLKELQPEVKAISGNVGLAVTELAQTLAELRRTIEQAQGLVRPDSALVGQLSETLDNLSQASQSLRLLADSLNRNPSAVLTGKRPSAPAQSHR
jgi:paraquat-inducible protein B